MLSRKKVAIVLSTLLVPFALASSSLAKDNGKSGNQKFRVETDLEPAALGAIEPAAEGDARYDEQVHKGTPKTKRFQAKVQIPVPSALALGITETTAPNADVQLNLNHVGVDLITGLPTLTLYATCLLDFTGIEEEIEEDGSTEVVAVYKVDVRDEVRGKGFRHRDIHGSCDNGTPKPLDGDLAEAVLVTPSAVLGGLPTIDSLVSGTFETKF